jgi:hypothetical protein
MSRTNRLLSLASRINEYKNNPHHIDPLSEGFRRLLDEVQAELSSLAKESHSIAPYAGKDD